MRKRAEAAIDFGKDARNVSFVRHIALQGNSLAAGGLDIRDNGIGRLCIVAVIDGDIVTARGGESRNGGADSAASPSHQ
jgi:hypothetical protein